MMAKPMKSLKLHYPMIEFLIISLILQVMTAILVALGVFLAMIFHIGTKEPLGTTLQARNSVVSLSLVSTLL